MTLSGRVWRGESSDWVRSSRVGAHGVYRRRGWGSPPLQKPVSYKAAVTDSVGMGQKT